MRTLHFDCFSGLSGDMTLGALIDAGADLAAVRAALDSLTLPITLHVEKVRKGGFAATQVWVQAPDETAHRYLPDIEAILAKGSLTDAQRHRALAIFAKLAAAEAEAHGMPLDRVHFHEVGALDSIADIAGVAVALDTLGVERFTSRPVVVGSGTVKCAHGIMPVPTPATALLLRGAPLAAAPPKVTGELTTPTGAAILATLVTEYCDTPAMRIDRVGHGAGMKDFLDHPNLLRVFVGDAVGVTSPTTDVVRVLETNLDDVPGEIVGYCFERLLAAGALDVYATPIVMKKSRPGVTLGVICAEADAAKMEAILFAETRTFGVRSYTATRAKRAREAVTVDTPWGPVKAKRGGVGGDEVTTPEYEDCARVARAAGVALWRVYEAVARGG